MDRLGFFLQQMKDNAKALEVVTNQMKDTDDLVNYTVKNSKGAEKRGAIELQKGISGIFEKAKSGDMSFGADLEALKEKLSKYTMDGRDSNK